MRNTKSPASANTFPFQRVLVLLAIFSCALTGLLSQETVIESSGLRLEIRQNPFTVVFKDTMGKIITESPARAEDTKTIFGLRRNGTWHRITQLTEVIPEKDKYEFSGFTEAGDSVEVEIEKGPSIVHLQINGSSSIDAVGYAFRAYPGEHFSGMGQRFNSLDLRGQEIPTYDQSYTVPIPFFISNRGYGLWVETDGKFVFDICYRDDSLYSFWVQGSSLNFYFIYGPTPKDIIRKYTELTGRMMQPPPWEFGVWKWRDWVFDETEVYQDATMLKSMDIPATVIFIDSPWSNEYIDYEFNSRQFPNPERMINDLHEMGYRVLLWIVPYVNPAAKNYKEADEMGYFVKDSLGSTYQIRWWIPSGSTDLGLTTDGRGGMIDFTNPDAVKWWQAQIEKVLDLGIDGFKMDDCEQLPDDAFLFDGSRGYQRKNYPLLYNKAVHDLMWEKRMGDFVLIPRAGWSGSQKYIPAFWAGDQTPDFSFKTGLPSVIRGGQSMGLVGFSFWGSDVGGYDWSPTKEVFIRWLQFGAFCPVMEIGGKSYHEPWVYDDETLEVFRRYTQLHTYLFPYINHYAKIALDEGTPIMRALFLEFPRDQRAYDEEFEYMFGGELLVAPVYQSGVQRKVYFPKGKWMDFWSHRIFNGPRTVRSYRAPLDKLPLFVRVSTEAVFLLYRPLFFEQIRGLEDRIDYVLHGTKKIILAGPAQRMRTQLKKFINSVPDSLDSFDATLFENFRDSIDDFRSFLTKEKQEGSIPDHVFQTLTERLGAIELTARGIVRLYRRI